MSSGMLGGGGDLSYDLSTRVMESGIMLVTSKTAEARRVQIVPPNDG
jgi:hypothetical protein